MPFWIYDPEEPGAKPQLAELFRQTVPLAFGNKILFVAVGVVKLSVATLTPLLAWSLVAYFAWKAYGTAVSFSRGVISPS